MRVILTIICLMSFSLLFAQKDTLIAKGNEAYLKKNFDEAEEYYRKGLEKKESFEGYYNLGKALFEQGKYKEALDEYQRAEDMLKADHKTNRTEWNNRLANTYRNLGNAAYRQKAYGDAVEAYKKSLRLTPKDEVTRNNYVKAKEQQKQQQKQQQQQQQQQQQMDKETAEQILQALEQDEKETQEKRSPQSGSKRRLEKEW